MLTREEIASAKTLNRLDASKVFIALDMAIALHDVADLVPGMETSRPKVEGK